MKIDDITVGFYIHECHQHQETQEYLELWEVTHKDDTTTHYRNWDRRIWRDNDVGWDGGRSFYNDAPSGWTRYSLKKITEEQAKRMILKWHLKYGH